jgi:hypothetical protein
MPEMPPCYGPSRPPLFEFHIRGTDAHGMPSGATLPSKAQVLVDWGCWVVDGDLEWAQRHWEWHKSFMYENKLFSGPPETDLPHSNNDSSVGGLAHKNIQT